ncbi:MAG: hypothetical protein H3C58_04475 [Fimbriimonadaceae bacterium]|nr:hypothetical protein [Fimbriimonadaceae bacterium]
MDHRGTRRATSIFRNRFWTLVATLGVLCGGGVAHADITVTPLGLIGARMEHDVNGTKDTRTSSPWLSNPLWSVSYDGTTTIYKVDTTLSRKGNQTGAYYVSVQAASDYAGGNTLRLGYLVESDTDPGSAPVKLRVNYSTYHLVHVNSTVGYAYGSASAHVIHGNRQGINAKARLSQLVNVVNGEQEGPDPQSLAFGYEDFIIPSPSWSYSAGVWSTTIHIKVPSVFAMCKANVTSSGGTQTVLSIDAECQVSVALASASINTKNVFGSVNGSANSVVPIEIRSTGGTLLDAVMAGVSGSGDLAFDMGELSNGTYHVYVKPRGALRKKVVVNYTTAGVTGVSFTCLYGDVDEDNDVDDDDLDFITTNLGKDYDDSDWHLLDGNGMAPFMADLNHDGAVTSADYDIADANHGIDGD